MARQNRQDQCTGRFWEGRFKAQVLLAPVGLEPKRQAVRAKTTGRRVSHKGILPISLSDFLSLLDWIGRQIRTDKRGAVPMDSAVAPGLRLQFPTDGVAIPRISRKLNPVISSVVLPRHPWARPSPLRPARFLSEKWPSELLLEHCQHSRTTRRSPLNHERDVRHVTLWQLVPLKIPPGPVKKRPPRRRLSSVSVPPDSG